MLTQKQNDGTVRPIAYASRTLQPYEINYGSTELEALAVVWVIKHFRHYLYGHKCDIYTDHEALKSLLNTPHPSGKLARWGLALQEVDLSINYWPGKVNQNGDALSRQPLPTEAGCEQPFGIVANLHPTVPPEGGEVDLPTQQRLDPELVEIIDYITKDTLPKDPKHAQKLSLTRSQYTIVDRVLYYVEKDKTLRVIPPVSSRRQLFEDAQLPIVVPMEVTSVKPRSIVSLQSARRGMDLARFLYKRRCPVAHA